MSATLFSICSTILENQGLSKYRDSRRHWLTAIFMSLVAKTFSLSLTIPEQILRWIGSSLTGGTDVERDAGSHFGAYVGMPVKASGDVQSRRYAAEQQRAAFDSGKRSLAPSGGGNGNDDPGKTPEPTGRQGVNTDVQDGNTTK